MPFRIIRLLDHFLGRFLLLFLSPLCGVIGRWLPPRAKSTTPKSINILKLHGGGSLLIAMPALQGLRQQYPQATITLIGTGDTQKYAAVTGLFNNYVLIDSSSLLSLLISGVKALKASFRPDVFIDLEPHSTLAAVFCPLTFATRRIGFVKPHEAYRAPSYTDAIAFNLYAPIHIYYEQMVKLLGAKPAPMHECQTAVRAQRNSDDPVLHSEHPRPVIYISAFASSLSAERMLPVQLWAERLQKKFGAAPFTVVLGGGPKETDMAEDMVKQIAINVPAARIINACGKRTLQQSVSDIDNCDEFWGIDSGPLHIARLLGKRCTSFWGPTNPAWLLNAVPELNEMVHYACKGDNQCMKQLFMPETTPPIWRL